MLVVSIGLASLSDHAIGHYQAVQGVLEASRYTPKLYLLQTMTITCVSYLLVQQGFAHRARGARDGGYGLVRFVGHGGCLCAGAIGWYRRRARRDGLVRW